MLGAYLRNVSIVAALVEQSLVLANNDPGPVENLLRSKVKLPDQWLYLAVAFGAFSGAAFAARRGFDLVGVLGLAAAQGIGGLLLAQILLQQGVPEVLKDRWYLIVVVVAALIAFFLADLITRAMESLLIIDALSLGLLCAIGVNQALRALPDNPEVSAVFLGVITAVGGGILRDILSGRAPDVLRPGIFTATAALIGAIIFVLLVDLTDATKNFALILTVAVVATIRLLSHWLHWETRGARDYSDRLIRSRSKPSDVTNQSDDPGAK